MKKLSLNTLKINSFITQDDKSKEKAIGGGTHYHYCSPDFTNDAACMATLGTCAIIQWDFIEQE